MRRFVTTMQRTVERCQLDLSGLCVLTEAATGSYAVTASLAAIAGANVYAFARDCRFGTREEAVAETAALAEEAGVGDRIEYPETLTSGALQHADIVTNSGHLRPLGPAMIGAMKSTAVIPLMYEAWEFRRTDVDLCEAMARNIAVAGTNECHPAIDVFSFLGPMAVRQLEDAGVGVGGSQILLLCDNPFASFITDGLRLAAARVRAAQSAFDEIPNLPYNAVLVALLPAGKDDRLDQAAVERLARVAPGAALVQFWGDIDRHAASDAGFRLWPEVAPQRGHMGILPSALGPEPPIRLQCGGLKVGEMMARFRLSFAGSDCSAAVEAAVNSGFAQRL